MSGLQWHLRDNVYLLKTNLIMIMLQQNAPENPAWTCEVFVKESEYDCEELIDFVGFKATDLKEAQGKAILAAFDLAIAYAFASKHKTTSSEKLK